VPPVIPFHPPRLLPSEDLDWVLRRAFGPKARSVALAQRDRFQAVELAAALGLGPIIAHRTLASVLEAELGLEASAALGRALLLQTAHGLKRRAVLAEFCAVAASAGKTVVLLKHAALEALGLAEPATRSAVDIDVLVHGSDLDAIAEAAARAGFERDGRWPSELHPLVVSPKAHGVPVECHVGLPGVRPAEGPADATFDSLEHAGLLRPAPGHPSSVLVPAEHVVAAHLVAHALVQHRFTPDQPAMRLLTDGALLELDTDHELAERAYGPIAHAVARDEYQALLELLALLRRGADVSEINEHPEPARLLAHVVASATDRVYRESLVVARQRQRLVESGLGSWLGYHARTAFRPKLSAARDAYTRAPRGVAASSVSEPLRTGAHLIRGVVALGRLWLRRAARK
jgi:hypothetical protein